MSEHEHHIKVEAAEPDKASYPWLMTVIAGFLALHLVGLVVLWLYFQRQSEDTVQTQVLTVPNQALDQLRTRERVELTSYGVVNREQGLYRVPVDRGINLYLETLRAKAAAGEPIRIGAPVAPIGSVPSPAQPVPGTATTPGGGR